MGRRIVALSGGLVAVSAALALGAVASAQESPAPPAASTSETPSRPDFAPAKLTLRVEPMVWYMGPGTKLDMPGTTGGGTNTEPIFIDLLGFDTPRMVPNPEVHVEFGLWRVGLRGYEFSGDHHEVASESFAIGSQLVSAGGVVDSSVDFASYDLEVGYEVAHFPPNSKWTSGARFVGTVEALAGVRAFEASWRVQPEGGTLMAARAAQVMPYVGTRLDMQFTEKFAVDTQINFGAVPQGDGVPFSIDVIVGGRWKPLLETWPGLSVQIGYRAAFFDVRRGEGDEEFRYFGAQQGLQFGLSIEF